MEESFDSISHSSLIVRLKEDILYKFEQLQSELDNRKVQLLAELITIQNNMDNNMQIDQAISELEQSKECATQCLQSNLHLDNKYRLMEPFDELIREKKSLKVKVPDLRCLELRCYTDKIKQTISEISIVQVLPYYKERYKPILSKCMIGSGAGELNNPNAIAVDYSNNEVYIADCFNHRIQILTSEGEFVRQLISNKLTQPYGIALTKFSVYVTDLAQSSLLKFTKTGIFLTKTGRKGIANGEFFSPHGLTYIEGSVLVCDWGNHRIQVFNSELEFTKKFKHSEMEKPRDIVPSTVESVIYILLERANKILKFNSDYLYLVSIPLYGQEQPMQTAYFLALDEYNNFLISADKTNIRIFSSVGELKHIFELSNPKGIAIDRENNILFTSYSTNGCYNKI